MAGILGWAQAHIGIVAWCAGIALQEIVRVVPWIEGSTIGHALANYAQAWLGQKAVAPVLEIPGQPPSPPAPPKA